MQPATARGSRLRSRPFVATVLLLSVLTAYSLLLQAHRHGSPELRQHHRPALFRRAKEPACSEVHSATDQCAFVKKYCVDEDAGLLPYLEWYFCTFRGVKPIAFSLLVIWLGLLFTTIGIAASDFFSINLSTIAAILGLSESLAGVTFLAFGNGSPDVFSTFAAMSSNSPSMALGELIGAACFITGVVAGSMALVREFRVDRRTYARDICFFIVAVAFAMAFLADGQLRFWECWAMVGYYAVYVVTVVSWHWYSTTRKRRLRREGEARSHYYSVVGRAGDELFGEPYRDEPENPQDDVGDDSRSGSVRADISAPERSPRGDMDHRHQDSDVEGPIDDGSDEDHERMVAAEVSRSMRVLRTGRTKSINLTPIRPSLVGALEFRSALAQLQRESNLQLSDIPGRSYSDHPAGRERRGTTSVVPDSGLWETLSTPGASHRGRAFSYVGTAPLSAPVPISEVEEETSSESSTTNLSPGHATPARGAATPSVAYVVGGNLAPPPLGPTGSIETRGAGSGAHEHSKQPSGLRLIIPGGRSNHSEGSSPSSPFPRFTDSPSAITPGQPPERTEGTMPPSTVPHRESYFPDMSGSMTARRRPIRWWPYALLPPPDVVLATLFPTLQAWGEKSIWDKFLSIISVPSIFLLVITLPVVESEANESSLDDLSIMDSSGRRELRHETQSVAVAVEPQLMEPEGEWERYRRRSLSRSRRNSATTADARSPPLVITLENADGEVSSEGGARNGRKVAKPLSDMPSVCNENGELSTWNRWLVCVQLFTGPLFAVIMLWANMAEDWSNPGRVLVKMILYTLLGSLILLALLFLFTSDDKRPKYHFLLCFLGFIISIAWISTIAGEVVGVLKTFGVALNISEALLGLTIFAAGNSVGDLVADITVARLGYPVMALSACFGGPMLNILLGIGIGGVLMMVQNANKKHAKHPDRPIRYGPYSVKVGPTLMISAVTLLIILALLLIIVPLNKWILSRKIGFGLIGLWTLSTIANVVVEVTGVWQES
ncbi:sodium/calcium exchanger protein [Metarhizium album ARSEF 1941]|uniref:Sodium/calcium exchanger protein n=1 Tax=Metarhizium album (strain ARSEF 1941) TaxID=1081103 RepID=A0A0B2WRS0_METAS|nr:sodium/calcium exchanger protein [Metarhizium album ARSEF 1941]KHN96314.1 sodium/calcium exchanger protein [Metarhizium album ARSEF 1941]